MKNQIKKALTVGFIASLPSGYYRARDKNGLAIVRNLNIDILLNRGKILKRPELETIWFSFEKISLNEYINEKPTQLYFYETKNPNNY